MIRTLTILLISSTLLFSQSFFRTDSVNFKHLLLNRPFKNTLKMYGTAVDTIRRLAYINSLQTDNISVLNLTTVNEIGEVSNPHGYSLVNLEVVQRNGNLLITNVLTSPIKTYMVNPQSNVVIGSYTYFSTYGGSITFEDSSKKIYLVDGNKVYSFSDSTFALIDSINFPFQIGGIQIDKTKKILIAGSRDIIAGNVKIYTVNLNTNLITSIDNITSTEPRGLIEIDTYRNRLYLFSKQNVIKANLTTKEIIGTYTFPFEIQKFIYNINNEDILALSKKFYSENGLRGDWGRLYKYSFNSMSLDSAKIGLYPENMAFDSKQNLLVIPNMHSGWVDILRLNSFPSRDMIDVAVSLDFIAQSPDKKNIYFAQRLGGSSVIKYNRITKNAFEYEVGAWPAVVVVDSELNRMFSLNQYEGSISVINTINDSIIGKIVFPIDEPRTDAIGTMTYNSITKRLYAVFPEQGKLLVGDGLSITPIGAYNIPSYSYLGNTAVGIIQLAVAPTTNNLFVIINDSTKRVLTFNTLTNSWTGSLIISPWPNNNTNLQNDMVRFDTLFNRLWIGNWYINPSIPYLPRQVPSGNFTFLGYNKTLSNLYTLRFTNDSVFVRTLRNDSTFSIVDTKFLFKAGTSASPVFLFDQSNQELLISEFNYGIFRAYKLDSLITSTQNEIIFPNEYTLSIFPNPFNPNTNISFSIVNKNKVILRIYDILGNTIATLVNDELEPNNYTFNFSGSNLSSGVYFASLTVGSQIYSKKILLLK